VKTRTLSSRRSKSMSNEGPVLCATDFSPCASQAARAAMPLAAKLGRALHEVHVLDHTALDASEPELITRLERAARDRMLSEWRRLSTSSRLPAATVVQGKPGVEIVREGVRVRASLLVLGSWGHAALRNLLVGSVAELVAESAPIPSLVVRNDEPLRQWCEGKRPLRVLLAFDFGPTAETAARYVSILRQAGPCQVTAARAPGFIEGLRSAKSLSDSISWIQGERRRRAAERAANMGPVVNERREEPGEHRVGDPYQEYAAEPLIAEIHPASIAARPAPTSVTRMVMTSSVLLPFSPMAIPAIRPTESTRMAANAPPKAAIS